MHLFLIRHADAAPLGEAGIADDSVRPLTEKGRSQVRALAEALKRRGVRFDRIVTSPLLRARQTAEGLIAVGDAAAPLITECAELAPDGRRRKLSKFIRDLKGENVALVGHQPDLSAYAAWLIGSRNAQLDMAKSGLAVVKLSGDPDKGAGTLLCLTDLDWLGCAP